MSTATYNRKLKKLLLRFREIIITLEAAIIMLTSLVIDMAFTRDIYAIFIGVCLIPFVALITCNIFQKIWEKERR